MERQILLDVWLLLLVFAGSKLQVALPGTRTAWQTRHGNNNVSDLRQVHLTHYACMKKIRLFARIEALKSCHSGAETRPWSRQSQNVTSVFHHSFICMLEKKKTGDGCSIRTLLPSVGCIVSCNVTWTVTSRGGAPVYDTMYSKYRYTKSF